MRIHDNEKFSMHTGIMLRKFHEDGAVKPHVWYNGVECSEETVVLFNRGSTCAGLDVHIYPKSGMAVGTVKLCQSVGGQRVSFSNALVAEDDLALLASTWECTRNDAPEHKDGFYQYSAAWDSKHKVTLEEGKTARVLFEMQEMEDGEESF